jgi:nanoRNase/pAp phosphatase (c-di-AMP/oligoRNAs hydrolase)
MLDPNPSALQFTLPARQLLNFLTTHQSTLSPLLILTHDFPDPDALAAAYALHYLAYERFQIESRIVYGGIIGRVENRAMVKLLRIPAHPLHKTDLKRYKNIATVDTQPAFQNNPLPGNRRVALVIDQHAGSSPPVADLAIVDTECGATCTILAQALLLTDLEIPSRLATALAYGILSDTLGLYRAHRPDVIQTYLGILQHADMRSLARIQNPPRSHDFFATLGHCIREAVLFRRLIVCHLGPVHSPDAVSQMAEFLLTYDHAFWAFCTGRYKGSLHLSLRASRQDAQAGVVLRDVVENPRAAGGHQAIAGGKVRVGVDATEEAWQQQERTLQARLAKRLRLPSKAKFRKPFAAPPHASSTSSLAEREEPRPT